MTARLRIAACATLAGALGLTFAARPWSDTSISDLPLFHGLSDAFLDGRLPYRDVAFEYPPLAAPLLALPGLAADYELAFAGLALGLALVTMLLTGRLARLTGGDERAALFGVALSPLLTGAMIRTHFDLAPTALTLAALVALLSRRPALGFGLLGAGAMTKAFPLVIAPVALAWLLARGERRAALRGVAALALTLAVLTAAAVTLSPGGALDALSYQAGRPLQVESGPATVLRGIAAIGGQPVEAVQSHRSDGLLHPGADLLAAAFAGTLAGLVAVLALAAARRRASPADEARALVLASLAAVAGFALFGKVLSPQFILWLVPLMALAASWRERGLALALALSAALTLAAFPALYFELVAGEPAAVALVVVRNLALASALAFSLAALRAAAPASWRAREDVITS